ncbi:MAG TPA: NUDIX domain-containing protein [Albitalea sp.]|nr:NUDIX domain-containing protein [Albitalea sp.]
MSAKSTSCGVLLLNPEHDELLLCHATGAAHWDVPKGLGEPGETPREAALRETFEETGLRLVPERLIDLGVFGYRPGKDLHLFATVIERIDPASCVCTSLFCDSHGRMRPEADRFEWTPFERVPQRCARNMTAVLTHKLSLADVVARARAETR